MIIKIKLCWKRCREINRLKTRKEENNWSEREKRNLTSYSSTESRKNRKKKKKSNTGKKSKKEKGSTK
jgi:hypothetical protein